MSKVAIKKYGITQYALYKCRSKRRLEYLLNMQKGDLKQIINIISYHSFKIDKKIVMINEKLHHRTLN